jgi:hypothetical protein
LVLNNGKDDSSGCSCTLVADGHSNSIYPAFQILNFKSVNAEIFVSGHRLAVVDSSREAVIGRNDQRGNVLAGRVEIRSKSGLVPSRPRITAIFVEPLSPVADIIRVYLGVIGLKNRIVVFGGGDESVVCVGAEERDFLHRKCTNQGKDDQDFFHLMLCYNDYLPTSSAFKIRLHRLPNKTLYILGKRAESISITLACVGKSCLVCFLSIGQKENLQVKGFNYLIISVTKDFIIS